MSMIEYDILKFDVLNRRIDSSDTRIKKIKYSDVVYLFKFLMYDYYEIDHDVKVIIYYDYNRDIDVNIDKSYKYNIIGVDFVITDLHLGGGNISIGGNLIKRYLFDQNIIKKYDNIFKLNFESFESLLMHCIEEDKKQNNKTNRSLTMSEMHEEVGTLDINLHNIKNDINIATEIELIRFTEV